MDSGVEFGAARQDEKKKTAEKIHVCTEGGYAEGFSFSSISTFLMLNTLFSFIRIYQGLNA